MIELFIVCCFVLYCLEIAIIYNSIISYIERYKHYVDENQLKRIKIDVLISSIFWLPIFIFFFIEDLFD